MSEQALVLLGPQQRTITVGDAVRRVAADGPVATITAGWQDREAEDAELNEVIDRRAQNLSLYARAERVWTVDQPLRTAHKALQERLRLLRRAYQVQLANLMTAWSTLERMEGDPAVLDSERQAALRVVQELDSRHLARIAEHRDQYERDIRPWDRPAVKRERAEIAAQLGDAAAVAIAGGHVAVLLNRLRLFNVVEMLGNKPIVAWSAGTMVLTDRVVLFHDNPPQGAGSAEMFDRGFGLAPGLVTLPHARERLRLSDPDRVRRLARRFVPTQCITLDHKEGVARIHGDWSTGRLEMTELMTPHTLTPEGRLEKFAA